VLDYFVKFILSPEGQALAQTTWFSPLPAQLLTFTTQALALIQQPAGFVVFTTELAATTRSLAGTVNGRIAFRSPEELADTPDFRDFVEREFPAGSSELLESSRRTFLQVMGASIALAGAATIPGCRRPDHKILSYSKNVPEDIIPGKPLYYATSMPLPGGGAEGLLVETHTGRPTKLEGNPLHSISQGKSSIWAQAAILGLYDPDRLKFPMYRKDGVSREASYDDFTGWAPEHFKKFDATGGKGLAFVVQKKNSVTRDVIRDRIKARWKDSFWIPYEAIESLNASRVSVRRTSASVVRARKSSMIGHG
jgi:molybdopterin-containing oxidoreductase family iron-sulfur binding subunit